MTEQIRPKEQLDLENRIKSFHKRWNIEISENDRWNNFKNRLLNLFSSVLKYDFLFKDECDEEFLNLMGIHTLYTKHEKLTFNLSGKEIEDCFSYRFFKKETDIKKILLGIEVISWMKELPQKLKQKFLSEIRNIIAITNVPIELRCSNDEFLIYPLGAKFLDEKLVNDNLDWLYEYPQIYELFKKSLSDLGIKNKERHVLDNLRLSIEMLLKEKLSNSKSLENQKADLGKYLKSKSISSEVSNLYWLILDYYTKYQNNKVKHSDDVNPNEVEFILYITGTFMRLLLKN
jgi:hypothetical protein